jgi:PAS domain S-box-containing protein
MEDFVQNKKRKILLVEDEAIIASSESIIIKKHGFKVITANTGEKAIMLVESDPDIDLILMDINLGSGFDGTEAARQILTKRELPIVFLTGHAEREMVERVKGITNYGYVLKNAGEFVLIESITLAFELFNAHRITKESKERYKHLYSMVRLMCDNLPDLIWTKDMDGKYVFTNKACCEILLNAKDTDEPVGKTDMYFTDREKAAHPENSAYHTFGETFTETDLAVLETKRPQRTQEYGNAKGKPLFLDVYKTPFWNKNGSIIGIVGCARAITEKRRIKEGLRETEDVLNKYQLMVETASDAIFFKDLESRYIIVNNKSLEIFALPLEKVIGRNDYELMIDEKEAGKNVNDDQYVFKTGKSINVIKFMKGGQDRDYWFQTIKVPQFDIYGKVIGLVGIARDITTQKKAEKEIHALLEEKDLLLKEVHHRVKNDMSVIKSLLSIQSTYCENSEAQQVLQEAQNRIGIMGTIHSKLYNGDRSTTFNIKPFLSDIILSLQQTYGVSASVSINIDIENIPVSAKKAFPIGIIVNELITNSYKYAFSDREKGEIDVSVHLKGSDSLELLISDNGSGITEEVIESKVYGFGLSMVDALVMQHEGSLEISRNTGTIIRVILPYSAD